MTMDKKYAINKDFGPTLTHEYSAPLPQTTLDLLEDFECIVNPNSKSTDEIYNEWLEFAGSATGAESVSFSLQD